VRCKRRQSGTGCAALASAARRPGRGLWRRADGGSGQVVQLTSPRSGRHGRPDPDRIQQWVICEGLARGRVGERLGLSRATGYVWLRRYGISPGGALVTQAALASDWRAGTPVEQLAAVHGLSVDAVVDRLIAAGCMRQQRHYYLLGSVADPLPQSLLRKLYLGQHLAPAEIAARTGATERQVRYRLDRYQLLACPPRRRRRTHRHRTVAVLRNPCARRRRARRRVAVRFRSSENTARRLTGDYGFAAAAPASHRT